MTNELFKDHNGKWIYQNHFVTKEDLISLNVDLEGAMGEITRWESKVRDIQDAISSIVKIDIETDSPNE